MALFNPTVVALCVLLCFSSVQTSVLAKKVSFVVHEIRQGANASIVSSAPGSFAWGTLLMNDNVVRETESVTSTVLGKSTGLGGITTKAGIGGGILSITKISFTDASKYNGSTLTITATFATPYPPYEAIVLGGTGKFRGSRGYVLATPGLATPPVFTTKYVAHLN